MKKILVPYDFSDNAETVLNYALGLAKELSAQLTLLNVLPYPVVTPETGLPAFSYQEMISDNLKELEKVAEKIRSREPLMKHVNYVSEMGDVSGNIVEYCHKHPVDFVVMGINQQGSKFMKALIGSNAVETAHKIKCTVIIVPPQSIYKKPQVIALASDGKNTQDAALQKAEQISVLFQAELELFHVVSNDHPLSPVEIVQDNFSGHAAAKTVHKLFIITEKKVSEGLLSMLGNKLIDMIIIEPKEHNLFYKLFHESVSKEVAFASPVPVMLIHS